MGDRKQTRIVVVGAGIIGASIAYYLSRREDVAVTILERSEPGSGASGHSFAWLNSFGKDPVDYHNVNCRSMEVWHRFVRELGMDVGFHCGGQLRWETTDKGAEALRQRIRQLQAWGYPCRLVTADEMRQFEPGLSPGPMTAASLSEADGRVEPLKVIDVCLEQACERGSVVHTQTPVTGLCLARKGNTEQRVKAVKTPHEEIDCDVVVLAGGIQTTELAAMVGVHIPQEESPGVVVRTNPCPRVLHNISVIHAPELDEDRGDIHLRQTSDGTLMLGQGTQESLSRDDSQEHADELLSRARHYLPAIADAQAVPVPVGYRPMPIDGFPVLGFAESVPNLYIALMHSGVTLAPLVGELATLEIVDGARIEILSPYRPERFKSLGNP